MHVLRHPGITGLRSETVSGGVLGREPGLQVEIRLVVGVEEGYIQAGIDGEMIAERDVILDPGRQIVAVVAGGASVLEFLLVIGFIPRILDSNAGERLGPENMVDVLRAELDQVAGLRDVIEVDTSAVVTDA